MRTPPPPLTRAACRLTSACARFRLAVVPRRPTELLLEAHSSQQEEHIWWVDAMFFLGFYLSFLLEKYTAAAE